MKPSLLSRSACLAVVLVTAFSASAATYQVSQNFTSDPFWDSQNNTTSPQNYGYSAATSNAGGSTGEIGGQVRRDATPSFYADQSLMPLTLDDRLVATGRIQGAAQPGSELEFGWFLTPTSSADFNFASMRNVLGITLADSGIFINFADSVDNLAIDQELTSIGAVSQISAAKTFSLVYDPNLGANGRISLTVGALSGTYDLTAANRSTGATFDHFGIFNQTAPGATLTGFFDDLDYTLAIPEPGTAMLMAVGGLLLWRRRRS